MRLGGYARRTSTRKVKGPRASLQAAPYLDSSYLPRTLSHCGSGLNRSLGYGRLAGGLVRMS